MLTLTFSDFLFFMERMTFTRVKEEELEVAEVPIDLLRLPFPFFFSFVKHCRPQCILFRL